MDTSSAPSSSCTDTAQVPPYSSTKPCGVENTEVSLNISYTSAGESTFQDSASSSTLASSDTTDTENISSEAPSYYFTALSSADTEDSEANLFYTPAIDAKTRTTYSVIPSVSSNDDDAKLVDTFLNLCKDTIQKSAQHLSRKVESGDFMMNRLQCDLLVQRLVSGTQATLAHVQQLPLLDKTAIPVLHELHQALLDAETLVKASCAISNDSHWPRAALEQGDMKETFSKLLYEVQWYTSVLLSILVDNSKESRVKFEPEMCDGQLGFGDELDLLIAMKKDEESLKTRLRALKVDDPTEKELADQLLNQMEAMLLKNSRQQGLAADDQLLNRLKSLSSDFVFLNPDDLKLGGKSLGRGAFGEVRTTNLLGIECAMKIIYVPEGWTTQDVKDMIRPEMNAIKDLGHHPHIVRLFCYSIKTEEACYLIMERMQMDLSKCLLNHRIKGDDGKENYGKLSHVDAVSLMLQIGEGIEYIHSKDMVHRDLKPQNILVNLENPGNSFSRICSVKIADFGLTKSKGASRTCSNNTINRGTTSYMAPEVMSFEEDDPKKGRFNPKKADVYSFAIMCSVVLTGWINPYVEDAKFPSLDRKTKKQVKTGLRPKLPKDCLPRLATLITRCWAGNYYERPLFPEICRELRFIKGLLLKGDGISNQKLHCGIMEDVPSFLSINGALLQGPWGGTQKAPESVDVANSIKRIKLVYNERFVACMEVTYEFLGLSIERMYSNNLNEKFSNVETITFKEFEFITRISGHHSQVEVRTSDKDNEAERKTLTITCIVSLTIHTNRKKYGPYGLAKGKFFESYSGRIIGFLGAGNGCLDRIGVVMIPGDMK